MARSFKLEVQQGVDSDDCFLQLPEELMLEMDWREGDILSWIPHGDDPEASISVTNVSLAARKVASPRIS